MMHSSRKSPEKEKKGIERTIRNRPKEKRRSRIFHYTLSHIIEYIVWHGKMSFQRPPLRMLDRILNDCNIAYLEENEHDEHEYPDEFVIAS